MHPAGEDRTSTPQGQFVEIDSEGSRQGHEGQYAQDGLAGIGETDGDERQMPQSPDDAQQQVGLRFAQRE